MCGSERRIDDRRFAAIIRSELDANHFKFWSRRSSWDGGNKVADDFEYNSGTNPWRLSIEEMRRMIKDL